jgi:DNA-binding LacI/PurR family transcriptional regulator
MVEVGKSGSNLMEVAKRCRVSQSTVSRVLNNSKHGRFSVSGKVRDRILKVAQELKYHPSMAARNLTCSKTRLVAVLGVGGFWTDRIGPMEEAVNVLAETLGAHGYELCLPFMSRRHEVYALPPLRVDGLIAAGPYLPESIRALEDSGVPYVSLDGLAGERGLSVVPDDAGGTRAMAEHLFALGHRRIAYLDHPSSVVRHASVPARRESFKKAAAELGFEVPPLILPPLPPDVPWDSHYRPFLQQAVVQGGATAVMAYSHYAALSLLRTAHDLGLSVPRHFSLACFNNEPILAISIPSITSVHVPATSMGRIAAELILGAMTAKPAPATRCIVLEETLMVRESTRPPENSI